MSTNSASFGKVLKNEFKSTGLVYLALAAGVNIVCCISVLLIELNLPTITALFTMFAVIAPFVYFIGVSLYMLVDYYRTMYGRQAYLTHCLPVSGAKLYWAKVTYYYLHLLIASIITVVSFCYTLNFLWPNGWDEIVYSIRGVIDHIGYGWFIGLSLGFLLIELATHVIVGTFVISAARSAKLNHMSPFASILLCIFLSYLAFQVISLVGLFTIPVGITYYESTGLDFVIDFSLVQNIFSPSYYDIQSMPFGFMVSTVIALVIVGWVTTRMVSRKISLR